MDVIPSDDRAQSLGTALHAAAVVELAWDFPAHRQVRIRFHLDRRPGTTDRLILFDEGDDVAERGRTVGYAIASMMTAPAAEPIRPAAPARPEVGPPVLPFARAESAAKTRTRGAVDVVAAGAMGVDGPAGGWGGSLSGRWYFATPWAARLGASARAGQVTEAQATSLLIHAAAGLAWVPFPATRTTPFELGARVDALLMREQLTHLSDDAVPVTGHALVARGRRGGRRELAFQPKRRIPWVFRRRVRLREDRCHAAPAAGSVYPPRSTGASGRGKSNVLMQAACSQRPSRYCFFGGGMSPVRKNEPPRLRLVATQVPAKGEPDEVSSPAVDDSQLLAAMRAGDKSVASAFHDRVRPQVDRTLLRLFRRYDVDHEDLRQLALIELVMTIGKFRGECSLDSWVGVAAAGARGELGVGRSGAVHGRSTGLLDLSHRLQLAHRRRSPGRPDVIFAERRVGCGGDHLPWAGDDLGDVVVSDEVRATCTVRAADHVPRAAPRSARPGSPRRASRARRAFSCAGIRDRARRGRHFLPPGSSWSAPCPAVAPCRRHTMPSAPPSIRVDPFGPPAVREGPARHVRRNALLVLTGRRFTFLFLSCSPSAIACRTRTAFAIGYELDDNYVISVNPAIRSSATSRGSSSIRTP